MQNRRRLFALRANATRKNFATASNPTHDRASGRPPTPRMAKRPRIARLAILRQSHLFSNAALNSRRRGPPPRKEQRAARTGPQRPAAAPTGESGRGAAPGPHQPTMRFVINGEDAFDVPETCLRKRASSLLTAVTACSSGEVRQLDPAAARLAGWGPGLGEAVERFFEDPDDFSLPPNVELAAFGGVADWLRLELDRAPWRPGQENPRNRRDFAWALRAKTFLRRREALGRGLSCMRQLMWAEPNSVSMPSSFCASPMIVFGERSRDRRSWPSAVEIGKNLVVARTTRCGPTTGVVEKLVMRYYNGGASVRTGSGPTSSCEAVATPRTVPGDRGS